jgi:hypothetical protein
MKESMLKENFSEVGFFSMILLAYACPSLISGYQWFVHVPLANP